MFFKKLSITQKVYTNKYNLILFVTLGVAKERNANKNMDFSAKPNDTQAYNFLVLNKIYAKFSAILD